MVVIAMIIMVILKIIIFQYCYGAVDISGSGTKRMFIFFSATLKLFKKQNTKGGTTKQSLQ